MKTTIAKIDKFFYDLYTNGEASKTELINFFNDYITYILEYNNFNSSKFNISIHLINNFEITVQDFATKHKKKHKKKQRNKENAKAATVLLKN